MLPVRGGGAVGPIVHGGIERRVDGPGASCAGALERGRARGFELMGGACRCERREARFVASKTRKARGARTGRAFPNDKREQEHCW